MASWNFGLLFVFFSAANSIRQYVVNRQTLHQQASSSTPQEKKGSNSRNKDSANFEPELWIRSQAQCGHTMEGSFSQLPTSNNIDKVCFILAIFFYNLGCKVPLKPVTIEDNNMTLHFLGGNPQGILTKKTVQPFNHRSFTSKFHPKVGPSSSLHVGDQDGWDHSWFLPRDMLFFCLDWKGV